MKVEIIRVLEKTKVKSDVKNGGVVSACCGGAPSNSKEACCKLDEDKKAEGELGCGCSSNQNNTGSSCCG